MNVKSRWTRALSFVLCIIIGMSLMPSITVKAATEISLVEGTTDATLPPEAGTSAAGRISLTSSTTGVEFYQTTSNRNAGYWEKYTSNGWSKTKYNERFQEGTTYRYHAQIRFLVSDYTLSDDVVVEVNGEKQDYVIGSKDAGYRYYEVYSPSYELKPTYCEVKFVVGDGTPDITPAQVRKGDKVKKPTDPVAEGYRFDGWYKNPNFCSKFNFDTETVNDNITLYAKWTEMGNVTINFGSYPHPNTIEVSNFPTTTTIPYNSKFATPSPDPVCLGYKFMGWSTSASKIVYFNPDTPVTGSMWLYANWSSQPDVTVTFNLNAPSSAAVNNGPASQTFKYNDFAKAPTTAPTTEGYEFKGWYTDNTFSTEFDFSKTRITQNTEVVAKWEKLVTYTVSFDLGSVTVTPTIAAQTVATGEKASKPADPSAEGWNFGGWYDKATDSEFNFANTITADTELYAKWTPKTYTVSFDLGGLTPVNPINDQTIVHGNAATNPTGPEVIDYRFHGWYTDKDCTNAYNFNDPVTADVHLYGKFTKPDINYGVEVGARGTWTHGSGEDYLIIVKRNVSDKYVCFSHFESISVDNKLLVVGTDCTVEPGSTVIKLKPSYLETLTAGTHTYSIQFDDVATSLQFSFTVVGDPVTPSTPVDPSPKTADSRHMSLWIALMAVSLTGLGAVTVLDQKKRFDKK